MREHNQSPPSHLRWGRGGREGAKSLKNLRVKKFQPNIIFQLKPCSNTLLWYIRLMMMTMTVITMITMMTMMTGRSGERRCQQWYGNYHSRPNIRECRPRALQSFTLTIVIIIIIILMCTEVSASAHLAWQDYQVDRWSNQACWVKCQKQPAHNSAHRAQVNTVYMFCEMQTQHWQRRQTLRWV